jgi:Flp pilus assembly protein TadD
VSLQPGHSDTRADLGTLLRGLRRHKEAVGQLRESLRLNPGHVASKLSLGFTLLDTGHTGEALTLARALVAGKLKPAELAEAHNLLGFALAEHGWPDQASAAFRQALTQQPDSPRIIANLLFGSLYDDHLSATELTELHRYWGVRLDQYWRAQGRNIATLPARRPALVPAPTQPKDPTSNGQRPLRISRSASVPTTT